MTETTKHKLHELRAERALGVATPALSNSIEENLRAANRARTLDEANKTFRALEYFSGRKARHSCHFDELAETFKAKFNGLEWENVNMDDYPDFSDAYACAGEIEGREMTDIELAEFNEEFSIHDFEDVAADAMADAIDDARDDDDDDDDD